MHRLRHSPLHIIQLYASIEDYRTPRYSAGEFSGNQYADVYERIMKVLSNIRRERPRRYHSIMHGYYKKIWYV